MKEFAPFRLDVEDQSLWRAEQRIHLTPKAFAILRFLVERAGRLVTQEELLEAHWPDTFVQPEVLKSQILDIRNALGDRPKEPRFIETVPRRGYRFIAPVRDAIAAPEAPGIPARSPVGRIQALHELQTSFERAERGERQIVFITGEQGMGKTTLLEAFLEARRGSAGQIARGQCLEGYGGVKEPYYPVLEALGHLAKGPKRDALTRVLEAQAPTWLIQLPALLKPEHRETLQRELLGATRERMIREMCEAIESLTETEPLVLLFEDLHWTDHATVDLISAIAHRRGPARLLLIGTYRPVDIVVAQHPLKQASHALKSRKLSREISLTPLGEMEVAEYLSQQAGASPDGVAQRLAQWIRKQTEGNPLFMVTVVEHLLELGHIALNSGVWTVVAPLDQIEVAVPDTLRQMIEVHIDRLSPREQLTLEASSVHGAVFSSSAAAFALDLDAESIEDTCQNLARHNHIIRTAGIEQAPDGSISQRYEFVHAVFRNVFYHRLAPIRRAKLHRRFAEKIESMSFGDRADCAAELADHFEQCADWSRAAHYLQLSASNAWKRFAYREAVAILERALQAAAKLPAHERIGVELRVLDRLAVLQYALHDITRAVATLEALAKRAAESGIEEAQVFPVLALANIHAYDDLSASLALLDRMRALIASQKKPEVRALNRAQYAAVQISVTGWTPQLAEEHAMAVEEVRAGGDRLATASVAIDYCFTQWVSSRYAESVINAQECLPALLESGKIVRFQHGKDLLATNFTLLGEFGKALDILDRSIDDAQKNEASSRMAMALLFKAWVHLQALDYKGVAEMCSTALPLLNNPFLLDRRYIALQLAASADLGLGRPDRALDQLLDLRDAIDKRPVVFSWYWRMPMQLQVAEACLALDDHKRARMEAERTIELTMSRAERTWQALAWELSARAALRDGDGIRAEADVKTALDVMQGFDVPLAAWRVHKTASQVENNIASKRRYLESSRSAIDFLAKSLETRAPLQQVFLSAPAISEVLGSTSHLQAAP